MSGVDVFKPLKQCKVLHLNLKAEYFNGIKSGAKIYEYRLQKAYWMRRLELKKWDYILIKSGYPKKDDAEKIILRPWLGYELQTITHPHFGNAPVKVFAIRVN
jgi:hypothetical protein